MKITEPGTNKQESNLRRITVNLTSRASAALDLTISHTGDSQTDIICRHVQEGSYLEDLIARGGKVFLQEPGEDELTRLTILI